MMKRRVALVFPRVRYRSGDPPLGVAYVAAALRRERPDLDVRIVDGTFLGDEGRLIAAVREARADVVGVFVDSLVLPTARRVARAARAEGARVLAGGPLAAIAPELLVPAFDVALRGEGEAQVAPLVDRLLARAPLTDLPNLVLPGADGAPQATPTRPIHPDLDTLPFPAWDLLDMERYIRLWPYLDSIDIGATGTDLVGSRGCPWSCAYCQPTLRALFGRQVRRRSPASMVAEIRELQRRYRIRGVFFHDDTLAASRPWLLELCRALSALPERVLWGCNSRVDLLDGELVDAMVDAGMRSVHLGIEAGSARVRDEVLDKRVDLDRLEGLLDHLRRRGAHALGFFMLGSPTETVPEMLSTVRLAARLRLTEATFSLTSVLPGTHLHERLARDPRYVLHGVRETSAGDHDEGGSLADYYNARNFDDRKAPLSPVALRAIQLGALAAFYAHPYRAGYIARHLTSRRGLEKLAMKAVRFLEPLGGRALERLVGRDEL
jgi:radical SAM superfamily enzyme YgiQ (UPF0313 family)